MAKLKILKDPVTGESFYPYTHEKAITDDNGNEVIAVIKDDLVNLKGDLDDVSSRVVYKIEAEEKTAYDFTTLSHTSGSSNTTISYISLNLFPLKNCKILKVKNARATSNSRPISVCIVKKVNGVFTVVKRVDYAPTESKEVQEIEINFETPDNDIYYIAYHSMFNNIVSVNTLNDNDAKFEQYYFDSDTNTFGNLAATSSHYAIRASVDIIQYTYHNFAEKEHVDDVNKASIMNNNILNTFYDLVKTYNITSSADCCFIGNELWLFTSGSDDHTTSLGYVHKYDFNTDTLELTYKSSIRHSLGHTNTVSYCDENDTLICGNGGKSYGTDGEIYILSNVSDRTQLDYTDCITISVDFGDKIQAFWGENNDGENNIIYVIANDNKFYAKLILNETGGLFDGTFTLIDSATTDEITDVNQGSTYYNGFIYYNYGHDICRVAKCTISNGNLNRLLMIKNFYNNDGTIKNNTYGQGIAIKNDVMVIACNDKLRIYKI